MALRRGMAMMPPITSMAPLRPTITAGMLLLPRIQTAGLTAREVARKEKKRRAKQDPYRAAQAAQRRTANLQRREVLRAQEVETSGDPVHGVTTPFLESLDSIGNPTSSSSGYSWASSTGMMSTDSAPSLKSSTTSWASPTSSPAAVAATTDGSSTVGVDPSTLLSLSQQEAKPSTQHLNHLVTPSELADALAEAEFFTRPHPTNDPEKTRQVLAQHEADHAKATEILHRLLSLENGSTRDRLTANIARCVDKFGRHKTDAVLRPRAKGPQPRVSDGEEEPEVGGTTVARAGPDTGSSEVQIAILTTKIRRLAQQLSGHRAFHDKANHRTLRLLVHKRQRLLRYMERKERGSERWFHMLQELGLTPATWKGQITL